MTTARIATEHQQAREQRQQVREERQQVREERSQAREQVRAERSGGGFQARQRSVGPRRAIQVRQQQIQQQQVQRQARAFDSSRFQRGERAPQQVTEQQRTHARYRGYRGGYGGAQPQQVEQAQRSGSWSRDRGSWSQNRDGDSASGQATSSSYRDRSRWASGGTGTATGATIAAMTGAAIATVTGRPSTSASISTRSATAIGRSTSVTSLPPIYFGQQILDRSGECTSCRTRRRARSGSATGTMRCWSTCTRGEVVDVIHDFFW